MMVLSLFFAADGDLDAIYASYTTDTFAWSENDGGGASSWTYHEIATDADGAKWLDVVDVGAWSLRNLHRRSSR